MCVAYVSWVGVRKQFLEPANPKPNFRQLLVLFCHEDLQNLPQDPKEVLGLIR